MLVRHGVLLSPKLADIFDMIERSGRRGVLPGILASVFYPNQSNKAARRALAVSVNHINDKLAATDVRVRMGARLEPYRVVKVKVRLVA